MVLRHSEDNVAPAFSVGDMVSLELPANKRKRAAMRRIPCQILSNPHRDIYQLQCRYGVIKTLYPASELRHLLEDVAAGYRRQFLDTAPHSKITIQQAMRLASAGATVTQFCVCASRCSSGRCSCRRANRPCTSNCHATEVGRCGNNLPSSAEQLRTSSR